MMRTRNWENADLINLNNNLDQNDVNIFMINVSDIEIERITDGNGRINLNAYANIITQAYISDILRARRELGFGSKQLLFDEKSIREKEIKSIDQIATKKGRSKYMWYGIIYLITEILNSSEREAYGGMSTLTVEDRWSFAVRDAITKQETWYFPLIHRIREYLFVELGLDEGDLRFNNNWNWKKIFAILDKRFKREVKIICFNDKSLREEERRFISENNLVEDGLNIYYGGEGGPAIDLPMIKIGKHIALGYTLTDLHELVVNRIGIQCSLQTVRARIMDYWESFEHAQIMFLRPILEILIKSRFKLYEINEAFNRFMLERIKLFFNGKSYRELLDIIDEDWSKLQAQTPLPLWTTSGKPKVVIPIDTLKYLIRRYLYAIEAVEDPKIKNLLSIYSEPRLHIIYQIRQQLDYNDWNEAREFITYKYLIKKLREGRQSPQQIYISIGYNEKSAHTHDTLSRAIFFGLKTLEVKNFLEKYPLIKNYEEFEEYVNEEKRNRVNLTKGIIDDLLLKYTRSYDMIEGLTGWFSGDFLNEVRKYYNNFKAAKWIVKVPYVIKKLKNLPINFNMEDLSKILKKIGYSEGSEPPAVFRDMFFGMSVSHTLDFIKLHPWIETYEEAKRVYMEENGIDRIIPRGTLSHRK